MSDIQHLTAYGVVALAVLVVWFVKAAYDDDEEEVVAAFAGAIFWPVALAILFFVGIYKGLRRFFRWRDRRKWSRR